MQAVRQSLNVLGHFDKSLPKVADAIVEFNLRIGFLFVKPFQVDRQQRDSLTDIVVQLSRYPGALLFMGFNQSAPNTGKSFFGLLAFRYINAGSYVPVKRPVRI